MRQHTSAYVSIRQCTPAYARVRRACVKIPVAEFGEVELEKRAHSIHRPAELYVRVPEVLLRLCVAGHRHLREMHGAFSYWCTRTDGTSVHGLIH